MPNYCTCSPVSTEPCRYCQGEGSDCDNWGEEPDVVEPTLEEMDLAADDYFASRDAMHDKLFDH